MLIQLMSATKLLKRTNQRLNNFSFGASTEIIQSFITIVIPFKLDDPYSNEEINAGRDEWAEFVKPLIID
ncbi:hypothetical protein CsatB_009134 [Cannabis sativa]